MINPLDLSGKRILVTGASSGLGREISIVLNQLGARIKLIGRDEIRLQTVCELLGSENNSWESFDLTNNFKEIPLWMKQDAIDNGPFYGLVHSAGIEKTLPVRSVSEKDYDELMAINTKSAFFLAKGFVQKKCYVPGGGMVFLSSIASLSGQKGLSLYSASKGAIVSMVRSMAVELSPKNIRVNSISPGHIETNMGALLKKKMLASQYEAIANEHLLGIGQPEDVAYAVAYLLAKTGKWITGTNLVVDGGFTAK
jgi:NAD(P)-dependent dehydrogenase (short-subunit alcohol dehydrogenase family)